MSQPAVDSDHDLGAAVVAAPARPSVTHRFGRFELLALLGKSARSMAWRAVDPRTRQPLVLVLPRQQPGPWLETWEAAVRKAARVRHPQIAPVVEQGVVEGWPYVVHDARDAVTLGERIEHQAQAGIEVAGWSWRLLEGLAYAHESGVAHRDLQPYLVLLPDTGGPVLMGLEVAWDDDLATLPGRGAAALDATSLAAQRDAAARDVIAFGLLVHHALAGAPALDQSDVGLVVEAMPPHGREVVRLPWAAPHPIPDALRAIVNRSTDRQPRRRYRNARTMARALQGWLRTEADGGGGPLALLLDRLHSVGLLPASPGAADRAARMALMERERTNELAEVVLQDIALSLEMLRIVNTAQVRGTQVAGTGPVLTVRRAIAMLGLDGVRRAALGLRAWPGPLDARAEAALATLFRRVRCAGHVAQLIRPPAYDAEVVLLVTLLQNLGRLAVQYHFPDDAEQIRRLMQPAEPVREGEREEPGLSEEVASCAVLGTGIEGVGIAVARHWGLDAAVLHMVRRLSLDAPVRTPKTDDEVLRTVASCANEAIDALALPTAGRIAALQQVVARYGRALSIGAKELQAALAAHPGDPA
ncbi:MAG: HDOD domain-containing protein [Rhodoferax sp.]|nr:HDOD domain-containing protein [Rhodoferax sp.]